MARLVLFISLFCLSPLLKAKDFFVSPAGMDTNDGSKNKPFQTFDRALKEVEKIAGREKVTIWFNKGTYYVDKTITLDARYSGTEEYPVTFTAIPGEKVSIKGSKKLIDLKWKPYKKGIYVSSLSENIDFDQLFINGNRQVRARFPNYDYENPLRDGKGYQQVTGGTDSRYDEWFTYNSDTFTNKEWKNPKTGIVHAFQSHNWGNMQYRIKKVNKEEQKVYLDEGGWQLQRRHGIGGKGSKASWFFIDNIFEELDVPGEWFYDKDSKLLYYYPEKGTNLKNAVVEVPVLKNLIQLKGSSGKPVKHITFNGFLFTHSLSVFMNTYEPMARGDWAIHRGGAVFMEGAENCQVTNCNFEYLGGNGVFMSSYNRLNKVSSCRFVHTGESAVAFVGLPSAVRFYQTWDDKEILGKSWEEMWERMDLEPGPKSPDYPQSCTVENSIMHDFGDYGKQVAGVFISMSHKITVSHNTIYNCPRAGICINDGTWGGHIIEFNDIWETVRETGEHGPFNSWGRERQWRGSRGLDDQFLKELTKLDALDNVIIRNNRIANYRKSISAGNWTIDLDDGSSYFEIYNNLNLGSTIKLRDGMARKVFNNITVSAVPLGWHVWPKDSQDEIYKNIFVISGTIPGKEEPTKNFIRDVALPTDRPWSKHYDNNLYWNINYPKNFEVTAGVNFKDWQKKGYDLNATAANPLFVNPEKGNFQVKANSPALKLGFENFPMDNFGHQMTRITPYGGDFSEQTLVSLEADIRAGNGNSIYYTLDGSTPTLNSQKYTATIPLKESSTLKAQTFTADGIPVGFVSEASFSKVKEVTYPSWYNTLIDGAYLGDKKEKGEKALELEVEGALLINIAEDPDLIDATGGYDYGCYVKSINHQKGKVWLEAGLNKDWVIQKVNGETIQNISDLKKSIEKYKNKMVSITAARDYKQKKFKAKF